MDSYTCALFRAPVGRRDGAAEICNLCATAPNAAERRSDEDLIKHVVESVDEKPSMPVRRAEFPCRLQKWSRYASIACRS